MLIDEEELRGAILGKLKEWVGVLPDPDKPLIGVLGVGSETLSANDIVEQVEQRTAMGDEFVQHWISLAVNHIMTSTLLREDHDG
ncbi:MAG: hypothetical protein QOJ70_3485 [Acidobacteriota bacterium]|jgi:hypothetical protein|nr:hypothetical protein [Acidobacteriota bacterium]MDT7809672.1 hypothetical protein [Acidobacteriota bacterium]